jgi:CheY-like chemotaxis protein
MLVSRAPSKGVPPMPSRQPERPVATVAHDLRNLLTVIAAQTERILRALPDDPDLARAGRAVDEALQRAGELTALLAGSSGPSGAARSEAPPLPPPASGGLVLVVDDDRQVRQVLAAMLLARGFEVTACASVDEARADLASLMPELRLAVLDAQLPDGSGMELLEDLRRSRPELPVVFVAGASDDELAGLRDARTALLAKPFRAAELTHAVGRVLSGEGVSP